MTTIKLRAATMTTRIFDGVPEAVFENGGDPVYLIGRQEIAAVIKELIRFYRSAEIAGGKPARADDVMPDEFMTIAEVESLTKLKKSTIYRLMQEGGFPLQVKLTARKIAWRWPISAPGWTGGAQRGSSHDPRTCATLRPSLPCRDAGLAARSDQRHKAAPTRTSCGLFRA